jgi:hypothetical protein
MDKSINASLSFRSPVLQAFVRSQARSGGKACAPIASLNRTFWKRTPLTKSVCMAARAYDVEDHNGALFAPAEEFPHRGAEEIRADVGSYRGHSLNRASRRHTGGFCDTGEGVALPSVDACLR